MTITTNKLTGAAGLAAVAAGPMCLVAITAWSFVEIVRRATPALAEIAIS